MRRGRRPLRSAETLSAAIEIAIARSALATKLCSVTRTSMRVRTRHRLYQSCVREDSTRVASIEVARVNAFAIARRGGTRRDVASGESREQTGMVGHALGGDLSGGRHGDGEPDDPGGSEGPARGEDQLFAARAR